MPNRRTAPTRRPRRSSAFPRLVREERGVALTEFALVLPWLLLLLLGLIDFGKAINYWIDETHLANTGARWAVVNYNPGATLTPAKNLQAYVQSQADSRELRGEAAGTQQDRHAAEVDICFYKATDGSSTSTPTVGDTVKVFVTYRYDWLHYLLAKAGIGPSTTIGSSSAMRLEAVPTNYSTADNTGTCPAAA
jgi:Flp pilus assembly protein TadG